MGSKHVCEPIRVTSLGVDGVLKINYLLFFTSYFLKYFDVSCGKIEVA